MCAFFFAQKVFAQHRQANTNLQILRHVHIIGHTWGVVFLFGYCALIISEQHVVTESRQLCHLNACMDQLLSRMGTADSTPKIVLYNALDYPTGCRNGSPSIL